MRCDSLGLQIERVTATRKLFELIDLNDDGLVTVDEFVVMGLNQTRFTRKSK